MKEAFKEELLSGIRKMNDASDRHLSSEKANTRRISEELEIDELIYTHTYSQSAAHKILGLNHISFKQVVQKAIEEGVITEAIKHAQSYKYTIEHIHALQEYLKMDSWKNKFDDLEVVVVNNLKGGTGKPRLQSVWRLSWHFNLDTDQEFYVLI